MGRCGAVAVEYAVLQHWKGDATGRRLLHQVLHQVLQHLMQAADFRQTGLFIAAFDAELTHFSPQCRSVHAQKTGCF